MTSPPEGSRRSVNTATPTTWKRNLRKTWVTSYSHSFRSTTSCLTVTYMYEYCVLLKRNARRCQKHGTRGASSTFTNVRRRLIIRNGRNAYGFRIIRSNNSNLLGVLAYCVVLFCMTLKVVLKGCPFISFENVNFFQKIDHWNGTTDITAC